MAPSAWPVAQDLRHASLCCPLLDLPEELLVKLVRPADPTVRGACRRLRHVWDEHCPDLEIRVRWPHDRLDSQLSKQLTAWLSRLTSLKNLSYRCDYIEPSTRQLLDIRTKSAAVASVAVCAQVAVCTQLTSLRLLDFSPVSAALDLGALRACTLLRTLHLQACLRDISSLATCVHLESLHLRLDRRSGGIYVEPLTACTALTALTLFNCSAVSDVNKVTTLTALRLLDIHGCLRPLVRFSRLARLERFALEDGLLYDLGFLYACPSLRSLELAECKRLWDVSALTSCTALTSLRFTSCYRAADVAPLAACTALAYVTLSECHGDWDLGALRACRWMQVEDA